MQVQVAASCTSYAGFTSILDNVISFAFDSPKTGKEPSCYAAICSWDKIGGPLLARGSTSTEQKQHSKGCDTSTDAPSRSMCRQARTRLDPPPWLHRTAPWFFLREISGASRVQVDCIGFTYVRPLLRVRAARRVVLPNCFFLLVGKRF